METKTFPHAGINHPVAHLTTYRRMMVSKEEYELVIQHRKDKIAAIKHLRGDEVWCEVEDSQGLL